MRFNSFLLAICAMALIAGFAVQCGRVEAQTQPSLGERQVRALETIAREMSYMRREKCR